MKIAFHFLPAFGIMFATRREYTKYSMARSR